MKNSIKRIGVAAIIMMFSLVSCDKDDDSVKPVEPEKMFAIDIEVTSPSGMPEKGIVIGTKPELEKVVSKKNKAQVMRKESRMNNIFVPNPNDPVEPVDPTDECWDEIEAYYDSHIQEWQFQANETCTDITRCLTCPEAGVGLFVLYVIEPTSIDCNILEVEYLLEALNFRPFPYDPIDYESDEMIRFIN